MTTPKVFRFADAAAALESTNELRRRATRRAGAIEDAVIKALTQWETLKKIGATRCDAAAELLGPLEIQLGMMQEFARRCREQLRAVISDPFGEQEQPSTPKESPLLSALRTVSRWQHGEQIDGEEIGDDEGLNALATALAEAEKIEGK